MQNYHFAPKGNFLGLIFKITTRSYLREFHDYVIYFTIQQIFMHKIITFH